MCRKCFAAAVSLLFMLILCSGCSLILPESALLVPPAQSADNRALQTAFFQACGEDVRFKIPVSGEFLSAYVLHDLDADGEEEAMVFYAKDVIDDRVRTALFDRQDGTWTYTDGLESECTAIEYVKICDLDADGRNEVLFFLESQEGKFLSVYTCGEDAFALHCVLDTLRYSKMMLTDFDAGGRMYLFTVSLSPVTGPQAALRCLTGSGMQRLDWRKLDRTITEFTDLFYIGDNIFYADAVKADGTMVTEIILRDAVNDTLRVPLLDAKTQTTTLTVRSDGIGCRDINADGIPEIPCADTLRFSEIWRNGVKSNSLMTQTDWCTFSDGVLVSVQKTLLDADSGWMFAIPDTWIERFTVCAYPMDHKWNFYDTDIHGARQYLGSVMFDIHNSGYTLLKSSGTHGVYVYGLNQDSDLQVSAQQFGQSFQYIGK